MRIDSASSTGLARAMNRIRDRRLPNVRSALVRAAVARLTRRVEVGELTIQLPSGERIHCCSGKPGPAAEIEFLKWRAIMRILVGGEVSARRELLRRRVDELRSAGSDRVGRAQRGSVHRFHQGPVLQGPPQSNRSSASRQHALRQPPQRCRALRSGERVLPSVARPNHDLFLGHFSGPGRDPRTGSGDEIRPHHRSPQSRWRGERPRNRRRLGALCRAAIAGSAARE